ncbi:flavin reductase family protein [Deinococcus sonorensis]|uniref:Flavin reductase family protein n=2 Tax=Deinococcus sonorensis TaxID=309891 RepID=A0AAU7UFE4_9DEIO
MGHFDLTRLDAAAAYKLLTGVVVPRPIAWVSTLNPDGTVNLAPFSFFNMLGSDPPVVAFSPGDRPDGTPKDTARNISPGSPFVVNLVSEPLVQAMNVTATDFPPHLPEAGLAGLELTPSQQVPVPRVAASPVSLECLERQTLRIGRNRIVLGEVVGLYIADEHLQDASRHYVNTASLQLVARMGGRGGYARAQDLFELPRITYAEWQRGPESPE